MTTTVPQGGGMANNRSADTTLLYGDEVGVTQADREAAAMRLDRSVADWPSHPARANAQMLRNGKLDGHEWVQEFARHRIAAEERCAAICDERAAGREALFQENGASINAHKASEAEQIARMIRSSHNGK